jgi:hypothetical protein
MKNLKIISASIFLSFSVYIPEIFAVQCPDNETGGIVCEGGGPLCAAAITCNRSLRDYFEGGDNKPVFDWAVEQYPDSIVTDGCTWERGLYAEGGTRLYCDGS